MAVIALLPGMITLIVALSRSPTSAFLNVFLPVLLLLPDYYRLVLPGLPDPSFEHPVILAIVAVYFLRGGGWKFTFTDFLVFGFGLCIAYSEYTNVGYKEAQNLLFDVLCWMLLPYVAGKVLIEAEGIRVQFAKRFVFLLFCVSIISVYEFRFAASPFQQIIGRFFPGQTGWGTSFRYGFTRIGGPYGHAILAGIILIVGYRLQRWLEWSYAWEPSFKIAPLPKARTITLALLGGALMTLVRGPWLAGLLAGALTKVGRAKNPRAAMRIGMLTLIIVGIPAALAFRSYVSVGRAGAHTEAQETAAYRKELIDKYVDIALQRSLWGWGRNNWPRVSGMPSIDNQFLLLALMHGIIALAWFVLLLIYMPVRLVIRGLHDAPEYPPGSSLSFTLASIYIVIGVSVATVYMGSQVYAILFLITGWADAFLTRTPETIQVEQAQLTTPTFEFGRIIV